MPLDADFFDDQAPAVAGYQLLDLVAQGGMAEVYRALQHSLGREVAIKIMKAGDDTLAKRFLHEARLVATLNHRNVVTIYDVGQLPDGRPYLSMELLTGGDLRQRMRSGLAPAEIKRIIQEVAEGLAVVHARGIIHRDIKPANILFRADGCAVLCDFGIAKSADIDTNLTHTGIVVGSPAYSSPEQTTAKPLDARSDLYSLGVLLAELLLGINPFRGEDYASTVVNQLQMPPPQLPSVDQAWQPILDKLLAKDPNARFSSCEDLLRALNQLEQKLEQKSSANNIALTDTVQTEVRKVSAVSSEKKQYVWLIRFVLVLLFIACAVVGWFGVQQYQKYQQINDWLAQAELRLQQDKLTEPDDDSAVFYFHQVLSLDEKNNSAEQGLDKVVLRITELARAAKDKKDWNKALERVEQGLTVNGGDPNLEKLKKEILTAKQAETAVNPAPTKAAPKIKRQNGFEQFLHNLFGR